MPVLTCQGSGLRYMRLDTEIELQPVKTQGHCKEKVALSGNAVSSEAFVAGTGSVRMSRAYSVSHHVQQEVAIQFTEFTSQLEPRQPRA